MRVELTSRVTINATPSEVFKYLKDLRRHYLWNPQIQTLSPLVILKQGQVYSATRLLLGQPLKVENVVTELKEDKKLVLENSTGLLNYKVCYSLRSSKDSTIVTCASVVYNESPSYAFAKPVLRLLGRRELQSDLQALKIAVENHLE